jgi:lipocalin
MKFLFILLALVSVAFSIPTLCPVITDFPPVDVDRYASHPWYEISVSPIQANTFEKNCICTSAQYVPHDDADPLYIDVHNFCIRNDTLIEVNGTATESDPNQPAKLQVSFAGVNQTHSPIAGILSYSFSHTSFVRISQFPQHHTG